VRSSSDAPVLLSARGLSIGWRPRRSRRSAAGSSSVGPLASGIDLEASEGGFFVVLGPNGAGKSTLLRTLVGAQEPLAGEVELCGDPVRRLSVEERAIRAATVFTDRFDSGWFSVFDVVAFGRYPYTDARNRLSPRDREAVESAIASVGLEALSGRRFCELSDGERQKALIARGVAQDCPLLVLDEPTAFLDAGARVEVFHLARSLSRSSRKAVVLSTHDVEHALRYADELWLMDRSRRFESGPPEALVLSGSMGRAFDGGGFRFDPSVGAFRSEEEEEPLAIAVEGSAGDARTWTLRLAERLGFKAAVGDGRPGAAPASPRVAVSSGPDGPRWELRADGAVSRHADIESLALALEALARAAERKRPR
jgi:iron complex transport system ATP-binding protein